jgi:hypothetical protein
LRCMRERVPHVVFDKLVQVVTIRSHRDYSDNVWSKLWMSQSERRECKRRGIAARRKREKFLGSTSSVTHSLDSVATALTAKPVERTPSLDSVVGELMLSTAMFSY